MKSLLVLTLFVTSSHAHADLNQCLRDICQQQGGTEPNVYTISKAALAAKDSAQGKQIQQVLINKVNQVVNSISDLTLHIQKLADNPNRKINPMTESEYKLMQAMAMNSYMGFIAPPQLAIQIKDKAQLTQFLNGTASLPLKPLMFGYEPPKSTDDGWDYKNRKSYADRFTSTEQRKILDFAAYLYNQPWYAQEIVSDFLFDPSIKQIDTMKSYFAIKYPNLNFSQALLVDLKKTYAQFIEIKNMIGESARLLPAYLYFQNPEIIQALNGKPLENEFLAGIFERISRVTALTLTILKYPNPSEDLIRKSNLPTGDVQFFTKEELLRAQKFISSPNIMNHPDLTYTGVSSRYFLDNFSFNYFFQVNSVEQVKGFENLLNTEKYRLAQFTINRFKYDANRINQIIASLNFETSKTKQEYVARILGNFDKIIQQINVYKSQLPNGDLTNNLQISFFSQYVSFQKENLALLLTSIDKVNPVSDRTETITGQIYLSPFSYYSPNFAVFVPAHEIGHNFVAELTGKNNPTFEKVYQCLFKNHPDEDQYVTVTDGKTLKQSRVSEDFADWFAVHSGNLLKNPWCSFLDQNTVYSEIKNNPGEPHSSLPYRLLWIQKASGQALPKSCQAYLESIKAKYPMDECL